jgi:hypothetical protein
LDEIVGQAQDRLDDMEEFIDAMGSPREVASLAALKALHPNGAVGIWVATDTGHWFSWDGVAWMDRGVFQARLNDTFIESIPQLINLNNFNDLLPNLNDINKNSIYRLNFAIGETHIPLNMPISSFIGEIISVLTLGVESNPTQMVFTIDNIYYRYKAGAYWRNWNILGTPLSTLISNPTLIIANNYQTLLPDANIINSNSIYRLNFAVGATDIPNNLPITSFSGGIISLLTLINVDGATSGTVQLCFNEENLWVRHKSGTVWQNWFSIIPSTLINSIAQVINSANYTILLPDLNGINKNSVYRLNFSAGTSVMPINMPISSFVGEILGVMTLGVESNPIQLCFTVDNIYYRYKAGAYWRNWNTVGMKNTAIISNPMLVNAGNYQSYLPDANDVNNNSVYRLNFTTGTANIPQNLPLPTFQGGIISLLTLINADGASSGAVQYCLNEQNIWARHKAGIVWQNWEKIGGGGQRTIIVGSSGANYNSLTEALIEAVKIEGTKVYVQDGNYDIYQEFINYYGADFFNNYTVNSIKGLILSNHVHVVFAANADVNFNYIGNNALVNQEFSPFNSGTYGFTLENLHIRVSNCRYCIHDERYSNLDMYQNYYLNCNMYLDNSMNLNWHSYQCIGGGLGTNGQIIIKDCIFESIILDPITYGNAIVSYHNSSSTYGDAKFNGVISGCYFKNTGTFRLSWYGISQLISTFIVTNNSFGAPIEHRAETGSSLIHNTEIIEFNNIVRN